METFLIAVVIIAVGWFAVRRVVVRMVSRRRAQDAPNEGGWAMASWLPAWIIIGGVGGYGGDHGAVPGLNAGLDGGATGLGDGGDWSAGGDGFDGGGFGGGGE